MLKKACIVFALLNFCFHAEAQKKATTTPGSVSNPSNPSDPSTPTETFVGTYNNELIDQIYAITNKVEETQNFVNLGNLSPDSNIALPFGIIKDVGAARYSICVDSMKFKSNGAYFSACAAIEFPAAKKKIAFKGSNIKFNPAGVTGGLQGMLG